MSKKMISNDSMTNSVENSKGRAGVIRPFASIPLSAKLFLLVIIALIPRIIVFLQPQIITIDGTLYIKMAKLFSEGQYGGTPGSYFSLYSFLIFLVQKLVGNWELSGQLISIVLGTLTVIPVFLLGRSLYDQRIGWFSALFYITLPNLLKFNSQVIRDPALWFFILFTIWLVWEGTKKNKPIFFALASVSAGLGALTRVEGFILWGVLSLYVAFKRERKNAFKRKTLNLSLFILVFPLLLSAIIFSFKRDSNKMAFGEMASFSVKFITAHARTVLQPQDPIDTMGEKTYFSLPMISQDALEFARRHRIILAISEVIHKYIKSANLLIILVSLGLWRRRKEGFTSSDRYLFYMFAALFLMSVLYARQLYYFSTRHGMTLVLPCLFFAGHGLEVAVGILNRGMERLGPGWIVVRRYLPFILTLLLVLIFLSQGLGGRGEGKTTIKEAGLWLKENGYQGSVVMGPNKFIRLAFYADARFIEMPDSWETAIEYIRKNKVLIVAIDSCTIEKDCPGFFADKSKDGFLLLREVNEKRKGCFIQMYQIQ